MVVSFAKVTSNGSKVCKSVQWCGTAIYITIVVSFAKKVQWFGTAIHISSLDCWGQQICSQFGSTNTATTQTGTVIICKMSALAAPADVSLMMPEDEIFEVFLLLQLQLLIVWANHQCIADSIVEHS